MKIGISGAKGSFSEEAGRHYRRTFLGETADTNGIEYLVSVENVLQNLEDGEIDLGIFPIENSNGGIVIEAVHAMAKHRFQIERLFDIEVHHYLLSCEGTKPSDIEVITSHDQALKQCRMYLKRAWENIDLKEYPDTAKAAKDLGEGTLDGTKTAVIAPRICADLYGLEVLEASIQDLKYNYTTFIAAKREE